MLGKGEGTELVAVSLSFIALASALLLLSMPVERSGGGNPSGLDGKEVTAAVSGDSIMESIRSLASKETRRGDSAGARAAAGYIREKLRAAGWSVHTDEVAESSPTGVHTVVRNISAVPERAKRVDSVLALCTHYDSRVDEGTIAPGADDNASGTAVLLEIARVLGPRAVGDGFHLELWFFGGEEDSLMGSRAMADKLKSSSIRVVGVVNVDMVGYDREGPKDFVIFTNEHSADLALAISRCAFFHTSLRADTTMAVRGNSDHAPFWEAGIRAISVWEGYDHNPYYHTGEDTPEKLSRRFMEEVVRAILCSFRELSLPLGDSD